MTTMTSLRDEIGAAIEKWQWYSTHKLQHINVKDLVDELLLALSGMLGDNKSLLNRISRWLEKGVHVAFHLCHPRAFIWTI